MFIIIRIMIINNDIIRQSVFKDLDERLGVLEIVSHFLIKNNKNPLNLNTPSMKHQLLFFVSLDASLTNFSLEFFLSP